MGDRLELPPLERFAAEHALGLLPAHTRTAAEALNNYVPGFARPVARWNARLAPLFHEIEPQPVSPALWSRIISGVDAAGRARSARRRIGLAFLGLAGSAALVAFVRQARLRGFHDGRHEG